MIIKKINKRGMFMTIIALVLITLFIVSFTFYNDLQQRKSTIKRVESMNNFLFSTEKDLERQVYIAAYRSIFIVEDNITQSGLYFQNFNPIMQELFFNSSMRNVQQFIMQDANYSSIQKHISDRASAINVNISLSNPTYEITQDGPWNVKATLKVTLNMTDYGNVATWNKNLTVISYIPVTNFEDPLYILNNFPKKIQKTPFVNFVTGSDVTNLSIHATNFYYAASTLAPSFLGRLQGNMSASIYGIESFVNFPALGITSPPQKTTIDYLFFSSQDPQPTCTIAGMPSWFRMDNAHRSIYNATSICV